MRLLLLVALIAVASCNFTSKKWAVLISGSNGYSNYRHQADVCHSYHVLINRGFNPNNIILLSYDDVANSPDNPFPGKLFNKPGDDAIDYNKGCKKDYTGDLVTPDNFVNVLTGNSLAMIGKGTGKVLKSCLFDHVFIFFTDHGGSGLISFPNEVMYANELINAFKIMYKKRMYKKMVVYIEACESGSMFDGLLDPSWNIYAVTASNPYQSSYATYCPPNDVVDGVHIGSCLGDEFSVNWMEDADKMIVGETLLEQYNTVKAETVNSEVCMYGDTGFTSLPVGSFIGSPKSCKFPWDIIEKINESSWPTRESHLVALLSAYVIDSSDSTSRILIDAINTREKTRKTFTRFAEELTECSKGVILEAKHTPRNFDCLKAGVEAYESYCGSFDEYSLGFAKYIVNACESQVSIDRVRSAFKKVCSGVEVESEPVIKSMLIQSSA
jgi:legumain